MASLWNSVECFLKKFLNFLIDFFLLIDLSGVKSLNLRFFNFFSKKILLFFSSKKLEKNFLYFCKFFILTNVFSLILHCSPQKYIKPPIFPGRDKLTDFIL